MKASPPTTYELSAELLRKRKWTPENEISCRAIQKKRNESFAPTTYEFTAELLRKN